MKLPATLPTRLAVFRGMEASALATISPKALIAEEMISPVFNLPRTIWKCNWHSQ